MRFGAVSLILILSASIGTQYAAATGVNFIEPVDWNVGDPDSTFQEWNAGLFEDPNGFAFSDTDTLPSGENVSPAISTSSKMSVNSPGYAAVFGSGGYYSLSGNYSLFADIYNHGGAFGSGGPYGPSAGTRVIVQTAASGNDDPNAGGPASIFADTLELVDPNGQAIAGGDNASALSVTVSDPNQFIDSPFGPVKQQEYSFEFWLPGYTGDFRVQTDLILHASFQHLRVDTLIVDNTLDPDFNGNGSVDGPDLLTWQRDPNAYGSAAGLAAWESEFGSPSTSSSATPIPEPTSILLLLAGFVGIGKLTSLRSRA